MDLNGFIYSVLRQKPLYNVNVTLHAEPQQYILGVDGSE